MSDGYDLVCLGSGPAGEKAAALAAYHGKRVAVVDPAPALGGTMVHGVATSKTMREAALYLTGFHQRDVYGVGLSLAEGLAADKVHARARAVEAELGAAVAENLRRHGVTVFRGTGRFLAPNEIAVDPVTGAGEAQRLATAAVLIATGSRPAHPAGIPFDHPDVLDSDGAGRLGRAVRRAVVIGGGAVACELASIFTALHGDVTLVESRGRLLPFADPEISDHLAEAFRSAGMSVLLGAGRASVSVTDRGPVVQLADGTELPVDKVIVAAGRVGNIEHLGLGAVGVAVNRHGLVEVDSDYRTSVPGVYAAGDVIGPPGLASVAVQQGRIAACHACGVSLLDVVDSLPPTGVYTIPEVASVGLTEPAARERFDDIEVGVARLSANARIVMTGGHGGLAKLVFRRRDLQLLGAHVVGDSATEIIHQAQAVLHFGGSLRYFLDTTVNVPSFSEVFRYAAYAGLSRVEGRSVVSTSI